MKISMKVKSSVLIEKLEKRLAFYKQEAEKSKKDWELQRKKSSDASRKLLEKLLADKSCSDFNIFCNRSQNGASFQVTFETDCPEVLTPQLMYGYSHIHTHEINQIEMALKVLRLNPDADVNAATHSEVLQYL